ncbi:hypothetical protein HGRIS_000669 [Hohenbuehelia grisea]|uniref:Uncharacterized protein n=1 Tax=Hohenbuehelia grisea TaxID=104357 RepID=A0ABR3JTM8_9AGAR
MMDALSIMSSLTSSDDSNMVDFMATHGDYVVFYIDFIASVKFLDDQEAYTAASELAKSARRYVGFADALTGIPFPNEFANHCQVNLLYHGLPTIDHLKKHDVCASPDMSFPVFPNEAHPLSRMAVKPEPLLPWKDCYHSSLGQAECRISSDEKDRTKVTKLNGSFRQTLRREFYSDLKTAQGLYRAVAVPLPPSPAVSCVSLPRDRAVFQHPATKVSPVSLPPSDQKPTFDLVATESRQADAQCPRYCEFEPQDDVSSQ